MVLCLAFPSVVINPRPQSAAKDDVSSLLDFRMLLLNDFGEIRLTEMPGCNSFNAEQIWPFLDFNMPLRNCIAQAATNTRCNRFATLIVINVHSEKRVDFAWRVIAMGEHREGNHVDHREWSDCNFDFL